MVLETEKIHTCFEPNTPILMANGSTKKIKNIEIDELVCGDDNIIRKVTNKISGKDKMYLIEQNKNGVLNYIVNNGHILVLKAVCVKPTVFKRSAISGYYLGYYVRCNDETCNKDTCSKKGYKRKEIRYPTIEDANKMLKKLEKGNLDDNWVRVGDIFELRIHEYLSLCCSNKIREGLKGFKIPRPCLYPVDDDELPIDAYFLGLWLGDGDSRDTRITSSDPEIENFLHEFAGTYKYMEVTKKYFPPGTTSSTGITSKIGYSHYRLVYTKKKYLNPIKHALKSLDLINNKHIPDIYINSSKKNRYKLLAGLIDSDGHIEGKKSKTKNVTYRVTQEECRKHIITELKNIADSLGIYTAIYTSVQKPIGKKYYKDGKDSHTIYKLEMSGENILNIPCLVERKIAMNHWEGKLCLANDASKIKITPIDKYKGKKCNKYVGLTVDGNKRFLLSDCTVVHGCDNESL